MCLFPTRCQTQEFGRPKPDPEGDLVLPCGKCFECISQRAVMWAIRAKHEISCHDENSFITLTYDDAHLPSHLIVKDEFQKFMKNLRYHTKSKLKYMVSHEYGSKFFRPHHHVIIFGWNPKNQKFLKTTPRGEKLFTSPDVEQLWSRGFHSIGTATERSAYYIASYALKGKKHDIILPTGESVSVSDDFDSSKRPAIGLEFFMQNMKQLATCGEPMPRYYLKKLKDLNPSLHEHYENNLSTQLKTRSSQELLAKYIIDQQKQSDSQFRSTPEISNMSIATEKQLSQNRDEYHLHKPKDLK